MDKGGYEDALRYLVARQIDIYVIQILSQEEIEPEIVGDLKLVDVEDDDVAEITVERPAAEALQAEPGGVPGRPARVLHAPRASRTCSPATRCRSTGWC